MTVAGNLVVLAFAQSSPFPYHAWTPLSILALGGYLEGNGFEVEYFDERIHRLGRFRELAARRPLLLGFSTMTCTQIGNTLRLAKIARRVAPGVPLVWGGTHPTMTAAQTLESDLVDFVVKGEGEQTLLALAKALQDGRKDFGDIDGLGWKCGGKGVLNRDRGFIDMDRLPFPYDGKGAAILAEYVRRSSGTLENIGYESSRGCPHACGFCYNVFFHKNVCRVKSPAKIRDELQRLKALGVRKLTFYDDTFLAGDREVMPGVLELLRELGFAWSASVRIHTCTPELMEQFRQSGCVYLFVGVESSDDEVLRHLRKGQNRRMIDEGIRVAARGGVPTVYSLMIGMPGETEEQLSRTLDFADEIRRRHPGAEIAIQPYVPLPGTSLYQEAVSAGFKPPRRLEAWQNFTHDEVRNPWVKDPKLLNAIYINSFLAFRYDRFLKNFWGRLVFGPLNTLSLWRWRNRCYRWFFEFYLYLAYKRLGRFFISLGKMVGP